MQLSGNHIQRETGVRVSLCVRTHLFNTLIKIALGPLFDNVKEHLSVAVVNESVVENTVNLVDPQADQFVSILILMDKIYEEEMLDQFPTICLNISPIFSALTCMFVCGVRSTPRMTREKSRRLKM